MAAILLLLIFGSVSLLHSSQSEVQSENQFVSDIDKLESASRKVSETLYFSPIMSVKSGSAAWARLDDFDEPLHYHNHGELIYVLSGELEIKYADGESNFMGPGQLVLAPTEVVWSAVGTADLLLFQTGEESDGPRTTWLDGPNETPGAEIHARGRPANFGVYHAFDAGLPDQNGAMNSLLIHESLSARMLLIDLRGELDWHVHELTNEVVYVVRGQGILRLGDELIVIKPGDVVHIPAGLEHKVSSMGESLQAMVFQTP